MVFRSILKGLAGLLDKYVPGTGVRHLVVAALVIIGNIAGYLAGQITAEVAGSNIATAVGIIFAAAHKPKETPPTP